MVYPAGGGMDVTARLLAKYVEKYIDSRVIVVNKTGGAGLIGHTYLAMQAKNDGYTVGILANPFWTEDELIRAKGKWTYKDLTPVGFINYDPVTWIVSTDGPYKDKSVKDLIALAKEKPGTLRISIAPDGSFQFLAEGVEMVTGAKLVKVPFQGGAPGVTALLGGHVDVATAFLAEYRGHLDAGKVRVVAVPARSARCTSRRRPRSTRRSAPTASCGSGGGSPPCPRGSPPTGSGSCTPPSTPPFATGNWSRSTARWA